MITIAVPGRPTLEIEHLVTDFNGTIAETGLLLPGVQERLRVLSERLQVIVLTADTFGRAASELRDLPVVLEILNGGNEDEAKAST